jgi:uncharacterized protein (DUF1697 family)
MPYIAFLRGINTGGKTVKKDELVACFNELGFKEILTVVQSGNVLFESDNDDLVALKEIIEAGVAKAFTFKTEAQVYTLDHLKRIVDDCPFKNADDNFHRYVLFLENNLATELAAEATGLDANEWIALGDEVIYWRVKKGLTLDSAFAHYLTKAKYKIFNTNRNLNTLEKIIS